MFYCKKGNFLEKHSCKGNPSRFCFCLCFCLLLTFHSRSWLTPCTYHSQSAIASDPPSTSAVLACHETRYLTHTDTYFPSSVLFIISVTLYISPYLQEILILSSLDPLLGMFVTRLVLHNNLIHFGSPASTASRPTAVALTGMSCSALSKKSGFN